MKFLVYDTGLSVEHARCLAQHGHEVKYFTPWNRNKPTFQDYAIGLGVDGVDKVIGFFDHVDWADVICFFDTGSGDIATFLRKSGYSVFGAGKHGEEMENHRYLSRQIQEDLGLPKQKTWRIKGIEALSNFLQHNKGVVVKHDIFRGDLESFVSDDFSQVEQLLRDLEERVGPWSEDVYFMVEEKIESVEPGFDLFFNGESFLEPYLYGYEHRGAYVGCVNVDIPEPMDEARFKLASYLKRIDYRCAFSTEFRIGKDGRAYLIDVTARMPYPLSLSYCNLYENFDEIVYKTALKEGVTLTPVARYVGCLPLASPYASHHWLRIDTKDREHTKIQNLSVNRGDYASPGLECPAQVVCVGESVESIIDGLKKKAGEVSGHGLESDDGAGPLDSIMETIQKGRKEYDIPF